MTESRKRSAMKEPALKFSELLNHKESLYSQLDRLWNFYIGVTTVSAGWLFSAEKGISTAQFAGLFTALFLFYFSNFWGVQSCLHRLEASLREMIASLKAGDISLASLEFGAQINLELKDSIARQKLTKWIHVPVYVLIMLIAWSLRKG
jgi:hypothetical protein